MAVIFREAGERDMVDVHIEAHPDRVGRDQEVDLFILIERHLRVARARGEPPHHDRATAATSPDKFGNRIDLSRAEGDNGGPRWQAHQLLRPGICQRREPRARFDRRGRDEVLQQRADGLGAKKHCLDHPARVQQAVGEDVAALGVGAELDLVHRDKLDPARRDLVPGAAGTRPVERHRLHRAGKPARAGRHDFFLAGDQRDVALTLDRNHPVIVFAGEETKREADDARRVGEHPLNGQMRLARVCRAEDSFDARRKVHTAMVGTSRRDCKRRSETQVQTASPAH